MVTDESDGEYNAEIILKMKMAAERYAAPCPFKAGDFVKYREDSYEPNRNETDFFIVLEVLDTPFRPVTDSEYNSERYAKYDIRIAKYMSGFIWPRLAESWQLEEYEL